MNTPTSVTQSTINDTVTANGILHLVRDDA